MTINAEPTTEPCEGPLLVDCREETEVWAEWALSCLRPPRVRVVLERFIMWLQAGTACNVDTLYTVDTECNISETHSGTLTI